MMLVTLTLFNLCFVGALASAGLRPCPDAYHVVQVDGICACQKADHTVALPLNIGCRAENSIKYPGNCDWSCAPEFPSPLRAQTILDLDAEPLVLEDGSIAACGLALTACPIYSLTEHKAVDYECVDIKQDLDNCGACVSKGRGQSCTAIEGVRSTSCVEGKCEIHSCAKDYLLTFSVDHAKKGRKWSRNGRADVKRMCIKKSIPAVMPLPFRKVSRSEI